MEGREHRDGMVAKLTEFFRSNVEGRKQRWYGSLINRTFRSNVELRKHRDGMVAWLTEPLDLMWREDNNVKLKKGGDFPNTLKGITRESQNYREIVQLASVHKICERVIERGLRRESAGKIGN